MGIAEEVFAHGAQTHGHDVHGPQQVEHGKRNNGKCVTSVTFHSSNRF